MIKEPVKCSHLQAYPSFKIEGGYCISCDSFRCFKCLDGVYALHVLNPIGKHELFHSKNINHWNPKRSISAEQWRKYELEGMLSVCYGCVEKLNHPSLWCTFKYYVSQCCFVCYKH